MLIFFLGQWKYARLLSETSFFSTIASSISFSISLKLYLIRSILFIAHLKWKNTICHITLYNSTTNETFIYDVVWEKVSVSHAWSTLQNAFSWEMVWKKNSYYVFIEKLYKYPNIYKCAFSPKKCFFSNLEWITTNQFLKKRSLWRISHWGIFWQAVVPPSIFGDPSQLVISVLHKTNDTNKGCYS